MDLTAPGAGAISFLLTRTAAGTGVRAFFFVSIVDFPHFFFRDEIPRSARAVHSHRIGSGRFRYCYPVFVCVCVLARFESLHARDSTAQELRKKHVELAIIIR